MGVSNEGILKELAEGGTTQPQAVNMEDPNASASDTMGETGTPTQVTRVEHGVAPATASADEDAEALENLAAPPLSSASNLTPAQVAGANPGQTAVEGMFIVMLEKGMFVTSKAGDKLTTSTEYGESKLMTLAEAQQVQAQCLAEGATVTISGYAPLPVTKRATVASVG